MSVVSHFAFKTPPAMQLASMIYTAKGINSSSHSSTFQPCQIHSLMTMTFGDVRLRKCHRVEYVLVVIESLVVEECRDRKLCAAWKRVGRGDAYCSVWK